MHAYQGLSDSALLGQFGELVAADRELTADIVECLAQIDERELHLGKGFTSLHGFCVEKYGFSEDMAFKRIRVARAVRRWPMLLEHLRAGTLSLAAIVTLAPHLDEHPGLIEKALGKSSRQAEALVAAVKPDRDWPRRRSTLRPVGDGLFRLSVVLTQAQVDKLQEARSLDRHRNAAGDLATLVESALDLLIKDRNKKKFGATDRPRPAKSGGRAASRKLPAADRRAIAERDGRRCTFVGDDGRRCESQELVEFDHVTPYADGGDSTAANSRLLCKPHNDFEARRILGDERVDAGRAWSAARRKVRAAATDARDAGAASAAQRPANAAETSTDIGPAAPRDVGGRDTGVERSTPFADAACALRTAGFSPRESAGAVARVAREAPDAATVEAILREALRVLMAARQM